LPRSARESALRALFDPQGVRWWIARTHTSAAARVPSPAEAPEFSHLTFFELHRPQEVDALLRATAASLPPPG